MYLAIVRLRTSCKTAISYAERFTVQVTEWPDKQVSTVRLTYPLKTIRLTARLVGVQSDPLSRTTCYLAQQGFLRGLN